MVNGMSSSGRDKIEEAYHRGYAEGFAAGQLKMRERVRKTWMEHQNEAGQCDWRSIFDVLDEMTRLRPKAPRSEPPAGGGSR